MTDDLKNFHAPRWPDRLTFLLQACLAAGGGYAIALFLLALGV